LAQNVPEVFHSEDPPPTEKETAAPLASRSDGQKIGSINDTPAPYHGGPTASTSNALEPLTDRQRHLFNLLKRGRRHTEKLSRLASLLNVTERTVKRDLSKLRALGMIETTPHGRQGVRITIAHEAQRIGDKSGTNRGHRGHENRGQIPGSKSQISASNRKTILARARKSGSLSADTPSPYPGSEYSGESNQVNAQATPTEQHKPRRHALAPSSGASDTRAPSERQMEFRLLSVVEGHGHRSADRSRLYEAIGREPDHVQLIETMMECGCEQQALDTFDSDGPAAALEFLRRDLAA